MNNNMHNEVWSKIKYVVSSLLLVWCILWVQSAEAGLQQVFRDGGTGIFSEARTELQRLSKNLETESTTGDISTVLRNSAALGFYFMLSQAASDCESGRLPTQSGKKLFEAGENAASGNLWKWGTVIRKQVT